jgi:RNA polymerase sigma factor (sigma-70 family)
LVTLVVNRCRKAARRRTLAHGRLDREDATTLATPDGLEEVLRREGEVEMRDLLAALSSEQRRVLDLRFYADLDLTEIALVTGVPLGTVKSRLHRALRAARLRWETTRPAAIGGKGGR